jgi:hypothetical protein
MTNPVNAQFASLPSISIPLVDPAGNVSNEWYRFFLAWWKRDGGPIGTGGTASQTAQTALDRANLAFALATAANVNTTEAAEAAAAAQATANLALAAAGSVQPFALTALQKSLNLSDVQSAPQSRSNLGVAGLPLPFFFPSLTGQAMYMPITSPLQLPMNLGGTVMYAATPPSSNASFVVQIIRIGSGAVVSVGTVTLVAGSSTTINISAPSTLQVSVGDTIQVIAPVSTGLQAGLTLRGVI